MVNITLALASTFILWLVTLLVNNSNLPFYLLVIIFCVVFLFLREVKYIGGDK